MKKIIFVVFSLFLVSTVLLVACSKESEKKTKEKEEEVIDNWKPHDKYVKGEKVLLSISPDPNLVSGKPFGYIFHFTAPFETFKGKKLAIYAYHKDTGEKITAVSPITIKEPSQGYSTLERFTATFEVPFGGLWRYAVFLNDKFYADAVLLVKK
ncbi:hypothetical protein ACQKCU_05015 [Heyndrickxia sporothermodurans]